MTNIAKLEPGEWVTLQRYPKYMIGLDGSVISLAGSTARRLRPIRRGKYLGFTFVSAGGTLEPVYLHRLVAEAAHGAPPAGAVCRHLDGNPFNCAAANLAWGTYSENSADARKHGTAAIGERSGRSSLTEAQVIEMRQIRAASGAAYQRIAKQFGVTAMTAFRAITGKNWSHLK